MDGQWLGTFSGTNNGEMMIDADDRGDYVEGRAFVFDDALGFPGFAAYFRTNNRASVQTLNIALEAIHPNTLDLVPRHQLSQVFPGQALPDSATVTLTMKKRALHVRWSTPKPT